MVPETRYAKTDDGVYLAYQAVGDGPVDLVWQLDVFGNVDDVPLWLDDERPHSERSDGVLDDPVRGFTQTTARKRLPAFSEVTGETAIHQRTLPNVNVLVPWWQCPRRLVRTWV